ncbi:polymorphic toxin-type HINT domain-containing protein [Streptomyces sp. NPDC005780]|uniref:polymorphic toxin-type HINT domain-containing protein n=1 Tax=Streptomyces sp. NPDC005780 TaxID=3364730 RepID=UPI0036767B3A
MKTAADKLTAELKAQIEQELQQASKPVTDAELRKALEKRLVTYRGDLLKNGELKPGETLLVCGGDGAGGMGCITSTYLDRLIAWYVDAEGIEACLNSPKPSCFAGLALAALKSKILKKIPCPKNSFTPGTRVLLGDGQTKAIENIRVGEMVLASDPVSGRTQAEPVRATITGEGEKSLVKVTVAASGSGRDGTVTATAGHPFWVSDAQAWSNAGSLKPGAQLMTPTGAHPRVTAVKSWTAQNQRVHNLTVADLHTYYVLAGRTPVLVHNSNGSCAVWQSEFDNLPKGKQGHVREMPDEQTMRDAFERWTAGAERLPARGPKIPDVYRLEDGTVIQWRTASASGGATVDIQPSVGGKPLKVHLP